MKNLLYKLKECGISIDVAGNRLKLGIPENIDATEIISDIRAHKMELLAHLKKIKGLPFFDGMKPPLAEKRETYDICHQQKKEYLRFLILGDYAFNSNFILSTQKPTQEVLEKVFETIFTRHEGLRTNFLQKNGQLQQKIHDTDSIVLKIDHIDLTDHADKEKIAGDLLFESGQRPFNFENELLCDVKIIRYSEETYFLLFTIHHVICDATSSEILKKEIELLYYAYSKGKENPLPPLQFQYKDYALWVNRYLASGYGRISQEFYKKKITASITGEYLSAIPSYKFRLKEELIRAVGTADLYKHQEAFGSVVNLYPEAGGFYKSFIRGDLLGRLKNASFDGGATLFNVLLTAFAILLSKVNMIRNARICVPFTTRVFEEFEQLVGWLTSEIIVSIPVDKDWKVSELVSSVSRIVLETADHRFYAHEQILDDLDIPLSILAPASMNFTVQSGVGMEDFKPYHGQQGSGHFNIHFKITEYANGLIIEINYNLNAYSAGRIEYMVTEFAGILEDMSGYTASPLKTCPNIGQAW
jgi:Condensation domain